MRRTEARVPAWLRRAWLVGATSMRRQVRKALQHPWIAFFQVLAVTFGVVVAVGRLPIAGYGSVWSAPGGYVLGGRVFEDPGGVLATVRGFAGIVFVLLVFLTVLKEVTEGAMDSHVESVLLAAGARSVAVGNVVWNLLLTGWQFGALILAGGVAFAAGSGSLSVVPAVAVAGIAILVTAVPLGFVVALSVGLAFRRIPLLREHRILLGAPLAVGYFALFLRARESMSLLGASPLGWYADLALLFEGAGADPLRGAAVLVIAPLALVGSTALSVRIGSLVWFGDDPVDDEEGTGERTQPGPVDRILRWVASRPTAAVTRTVWRRLRREPRTLLFAALPIALTGSVGLEIASQRPGAVPVVVGVYGAATVGMGATLNPLGSLGAGLPAALTVPRGGRHLVRGYALSAALPGVPVVGGATLLGAVAVGAPPLPAVALAALSGVMAGTATLVSMAVGVALPNMDGLRPTGSGIRPPRLWATTVFLIVVALLGTPALVGVGWADRVAVTAGGSPPVVAAVGVGITLGLAALASVVSYRRALDAIARYTVD